MRALSLLAAGSLVACAVPAAAEGHVCPMAAARAAAETHHVAMEKKDIVDTAVGAGDFTTLVAAVKAAGLVETLKGEGPFTVFAPTDAAFAKVGTDTLNMLLKPENKDKLTAILTYHVVEGKVLAADAVKLAGQEVETVNGAKAAIAVDGDTVTIDGATVTATDIECSNGVIHVIDAVMMP